MHIAASGYLHARYAASLAEFGNPRLLPRCGGWIIERNIPGSSWRDAMGCYPLFTCRDWKLIADDLMELENELVSVIVVTDPFGNFHKDDLARAFPDRVDPLKDHFVIDLERSSEDFVHPHHQRSARKALSVLSVEDCAEPSQFLNEWCDYYATLIDRHRIRGVPAFSRASFREQLEVPGIKMLRATYRGEGVGMNLWYVNEGVGYYHLGAYSKEGYQLRASFALFQHAITQFAASGLRWLNLGAGAGASERPSGLTRFKQGWATGSRPTYLCGRILNREKFAELATVHDSKYFPGYREGEFA